MRFFPSLKPTTILFWAAITLIMAACERPAPGPFRYVSTVAGVSGEFGETFGIAVNEDQIFVSDGAAGTVVTLAKAGPATWSALDTPSGICIDADGRPIVVDSGANAVFKMDSGPVLLAGVKGQRGSSDGGATSSLFNGPVGVACLGHKVFIADTYNDRIRVIENGKVMTLAGSSNGFADGVAGEVQFNTPTGLAIWNDRLLVADTGNRRIRVVEMDGRVWTLAGNENAHIQDGTLSEASFVQPAALVASGDKIYVADSNAIRRIDTGPDASITTISNPSRGLADGDVGGARFNRPSGLAIDANGDLLVADSENRLVRRISASEKGKTIPDAQIAAVRQTPEEFRLAAPARWPFDPPDARRDIAGTLGELRGEIADGNEDPKWFHNGLDIAGGYGETARFIRDEKVLKPVAVENFDTLRELIRMPTLGYIHIRLGRDADSVPFNDPRFQFLTDATGKLTGVRIPRGTKFRAGEPLGTLNAMNHVHLIAGPTGGEMNALDALDLPGVTDSRPPVIENVALFDENWSQIETAPRSSRIKLSSPTRVVVRAFDQMDGNAERRRLGVYKLGYQVFRTDGSPAGDLHWTISFARMPTNDLVTLAYANGSRSGAKVETIFDYIVTNTVDGELGKEQFVEPTQFEPGVYTLRVFAADRFDNIASKDIEFEVTR